MDGQLHRTCKRLTAAYLQRNDTGNLLTEALRNDQWLAPFLNGGIPGKDNGFDIEGLAVYQEKTLIGLRGPVLRGMAVVLEVEVEPIEAPYLGLKSLGKSGDRYKKHFFDLDGLGIRELCRCGQDLLILAGPTMDLDGVLRVFRLFKAFDLPDNSLTQQEPGKLEWLFDIAYGKGTDRAEGMTLFSEFNQIPSVLVVYDTPDSARELLPNGVFADVFQV